MDYIYINEHSLSTQLCQDIIELYNKNSSNHYKGITAGGLNIDVKDTTDYIIPSDIDNKNEWYKVSEFLKKELHKNIKKYIIKINSFVNSNDNYNIKYNFIYDLDFLNNTYFFQYDSLMIQRYEKNKGKYIFHNDSMCDFKKERYRIFTFIWYLNDVNIGGETQFWDSYKIKPQSGKLVLFPACWTFPHCGKIPISDDKYIITGWIYVNNNIHVVDSVRNIILNSTQDKK
jgi:hypothetical protein